MPETIRKRFAVIGAGISGLSAAWLLSTRHDVVLYEREDRLGGHANTVTVPGRDGDIHVDTGFIVFNDWTYPNFKALLAYLDVETHASDMSFAVSADNGAFEYSGGTLAGVFSQPGNIVKPRFWRMLRDLHRFYSTAPELLSSGALEDMTLGALLDRDGYSHDFQRDHLLPMAAAIWSGTVEGMRDYPATAFVRFFVNHGLFKYVGRPAWHTVTGGSRSYVEKISAGIEVRTGGVRAVERGTGVKVVDAQGQEDRFDAVIMASHADEALGMLSDTDALESGLLSKFKYQKNLAVLHTDTSLMPSRRRAWSSWNYMARRNEAEDEHSVCVTYWMNNLQDLGNAEDLFVTLNPVTPPAQEKILRTFQYMHPLFDHQTDTAQQNLWKLQGHRNTWYCGSYFGAGFHEDGLQSGLWAAEDAGNVRRPWQVDDESGRIHTRADAQEAAE
ncbi:MAG: FAD-dependent oxidoreductase [Rhodospirillales bacterium]